MIDLNLNKTQLSKVAGVSTNVVAKLSKNDFISMESLLRICKALHCDVGDIIEVIEESDLLKITEYPFRNESSLLRVAENNVGYRNE
jgi:DNA-binding Xre family transcriptional regulator